MAGVDTVFVISPMDEHVEERELTGEAPMSLAEWVAAHRDSFEAPHIPTGI